MYQYFDTLTDDSGNSLLGATVKVANYPSGTDASIYQSNGTTQPVANSTVTSDITGQISFFAPDGAYTLTYSYKGTQYKVRSPVQILDPMGFVDATDTGSANSIVVAGSQYPAQLYSGLKLAVVVKTANTGATILTYQGGASQQVLQGTLSMQPGQLQPGSILRVEWNGTSWQFIGILSVPIYPVTSAETAAAVTPVNYTIPPNNLPRLVTNTTPGTTDVTAGVASLLAAAKVAPASDGVNFPVSVPTGIYAISGQVQIPYSVNFYGAGERSTRFLLTATFGTITSGIFRLGDGTGPLFGTRLNGVLIDAASIASSAGVFSSDLQSGGCENVTVNNFRDYGFHFDPAGTTFGSVNGYYMHQCQAFKANAGGVGGFGFSAKDGTFFALYELCQTTGTKDNQLSVGHFFQNLPTVMLASNADGSIIAGGNGIGFGVQYGTGVPAAFNAGFTALRCDVGVKISTAGHVTLASIYTSSCTTPIVDDGNGGGVAKSITDAVIPLLVRGANPAHFDYLKVWGSATVAAATVSGALTITGSLLTSGSGTFTQVADKNTDVPYSASMAIDASLGANFIITATNGTAFTINSPTNPVQGQRITVTIRNSSGGALGVVTWGATYRLSTWTQPANGQNRSIDFAYYGTAWIERARTPADVPN